jgi:hypothetical protein
MTLFRDRRRVTSLGHRPLARRPRSAHPRCPGEGPLTPQNGPFLCSSRSATSPAGGCRRGSRSSAPCDEDADDKEDEEAAEPARSAAEEIQQDQPDEDGEAHPRVSFGKRNAPTAQPRRMRDAPGLGCRSAGDREPGLFDLDDEVAGEAGLDGDFHRGWIPRRREPRRRAVDRGAGDFRMIRILRQDRRRRHRRPGRARPSAVAFLEFLGIPLKNIYGQIPETRRPSPQLEVPWCGHPKALPTRGRQGQWVRLRSAAHRLFLRQIDSGILHSVSHYAKHHYI